MFTRKLLCRPTAAFYEQREQLRRKLQEGLIAQGVVPHGTTLCIFGSSANGFGTASSDMDMCIFPPPGIKVEPSLRPALIDNVAAALERIGAGTPVGQQLVEDDSDYECPYKVSVKPANREKLKLVHKLRRYGGCQLSCHCADSNRHV
eukprot:COSAG01_NODE_2877_length_6927_cov_10.144259_4_plen_148_part_00